jgi:protein tyrosine phosphatase (PTP) superfamily phosphohydrolase (DUF442 family)
VFTVLVHYGYILIGPNFRTVLPGQIYRCAQPTGDEIRAAIRKHGIRTVLNLRGSCDPTPWYLDECRAAASNGVSLEDFGFSAGRLPAVPTIRQLVLVLEKTEYPILIHCQRGADRTGMTSAMALLLRTDATLEEARKQLSPRYGHISFGRTGHLDRFFDLYEEWLAGQGLEHSPHLFRRWVMEEYCPGECRAKIEILDRSPPLHLPLGRQIAVKARCTNTSIKPWVFQPGSNAGIHAHFALFGPDAKNVGDGKAGLFHATVPPGAHIDLTLALPAVKQPGKYTLRVDLADEQHGSFLQFGADPLFCEVEVP